MRRSKTAIHAKPEPARPTPRAGGPGAPRRFRRPDAQALTAALLPWFAAQARPLPWRRTTDPYAIWISEIMLQQTRVQTVVSYWERWMRELPDIAALAAAAPERVLKLWEGLGYYSRARRLQEAARLIQTRHGGHFPANYEDILALPGIGRYTAGAIASIAFNQPAAILDGNVERVLCRVFGVTDNPRGKPVNARLWNLAGQLVNQAANGHATARACADLNQSLMELGALLCTPRQPACEQCPVAGHCAARASGQQERLPNLAPRAASIRRVRIAVIAEHRGNILVTQCPNGSVNESLWEFPSADWPAQDRPTAASAGKLLRLPLRALRPFATVRHSITRYRIELTAYRAKAGRAPEAGERWIAPEDLAGLPMSAAHRKLARQLLGALTKP